MTTESTREKLTLFWRTNGRMPTFRELAGLVGYRSTNAVAQLVCRLKEQGMVVSGPTGGLLVGPQLMRLPRMLSSIEAGFGGASDGELDDTLSLDEWLIDKPEATYILRVKGDSMIDAAICEGDMVVAERGATARPGDIVIAAIDGKWTMKYYQTENGRIFLRAANSNYPDMYPSESLTVAAVVRGVVRKYV